jgi:inner membrane protein
VLARSHVALAVAPYLALLSHPPPLPVAAPVLWLPPGESAADPVVAVALSVAVVALAALAPDLDHAGSTLARVAGPVSRGLARGLARLLKHRGPLHSPMAALLAGVLATLLGARLGVTGLGLLVGYGWAAHVLADAVTDRGVPLLWPLRRRRVRRPRGLGPATGGTGEAVVVVAGLLACGAWIAAGLTA